MNKSRKKRTDGSKRGLTDQELRRYVIFLIIPGIVILLVAAVLVAGRQGGFGEGAGNAPGAASSSEASYKADSGIEITDTETPPPDTKQYIMDFGGSILEQDTIPGINQLMEQYFLSISDVDMATFLHLFTSQDTSEESRYAQEFERQKQYIEGYQNISCYTTPGLAENEYAAYVYYEIRYAGVETPAPSLVQVYAVLGSDGQYRIYDQERTPQMTEFLEQLYVNEDVRLLISQVDQKTESAMEADPALRERIEYMKNGPAYMQESE